MGSLLRCYKLPPQPSWLWHQSCCWLMQSVTGKDIAVKTPSASQVCILAHFQPALVAWQPKQVLLRRYVNGTTHRLIVAGKTQTQPRGV